MSQEPAGGVLEMHPKGFGFLRDSGRSFAAQPGDAYVPAPLIQKHGLRVGVHLSGPAEPPQKGSGPRLVRVEAIEGKPPDELRRRNFDELTPVDPHEMLVLETGAQPLTTRVMDLLTPIGKGQRGLL